MFPFPGMSNSPNKLMICMPFGKRTTRYLSLLQGEHRKSHLHPLMYYDPDERFGYTAEVNKVHSDDHLISKLPHVSKLNLFWGLFRGEGWSVEKSGCSFHWDFDCSHSILWKFLNYSTPAVNTIVIFIGLLPGGRVGDHPSEYLLDYR